MDKQLCHYNMWGKITYPFVKFNGPILESLGMNIE